MTKPNKYGDHQYFDSHHLKHLCKWELLRCSIKNIKAVTRTWTHKSRCFFFSNWNHEESRGTCQGWQLQSHCVHTVAHNAIQSAKKIFGTQHLEKFVLCVIPFEQRSPFCKPQADIVFLQIVLKQARCWLILPSALFDAAPILLRNTGIDGRVPKSSFFLPHGERLNLVRCIE